MEELNQKIKDDFLSEIKQLEEKIDADPAAQRLLSLLETLKALEGQESELQSNCILEHAKLLGQIDEFEELLQRGKEGKLSESLDHTFQDSTQKLDSEKRELAAKLRSIVSFKRQLDDVPSQAELIQYELRFSELYTHIQAKHRQTRKYYATYNTLLEIKELMLKEMSLLNSISSQFKDALTSPVGRKKLIDSIEGILHGTQQKLEKVKIALHSEQKARDTLKKTYATAISEQRHYNSLLKDFQSCSCFSLRKRIFLNHDPDYQSVGTLTEEDKHLWSQNLYTLFNPSGSCSMKRNVQRMRDFACRHHQNLC